MNTALLLLTLASQPLRFEEAVQRALENHPSMQLGRADVARAEAQLEQARAPSLPYLGANAIGTQLDGDRILNDRVIMGATQLSANPRPPRPLSPCPSPRRLPA